MGLFFLVKMFRISLQPMKMSLVSIRLQQIQVRYQNVIADLASMVVQLKNILCNNSNHMQKHFLHASGKKKCKEFIVENESNEDFRNGCTYC